MSTASRGEEGWKPVGPLCLRGTHNWAVQASMVTWASRRWNLPTEHAQGMRTKLKTQPLKHQHLGDGKQHFPELLASPS